MEYDSIVPPNTNIKKKEKSTVIISDSNDYETKGLNGDISALGIITSTGIDSSLPLVQDDYEHVVVKPEGKTIFQRKQGHPANVVPEIWFPNVPIQKEEIITKKNGVYGDTTFKTDTEFFNPITGEQIHLSAGHGAIPSPAGRKYKHIVSEPIGVDKSSEYDKKWTPAGQSEQGDYLPTRGVMSFYDANIQWDSPPSDASHEYWSADFQPVPGSWRPSPSLFPDIPYQLPGDKSQNIDIPLWKQGDYIWGASDDAFWLSRPHQRKRDKQREQAVSLNDLISII